MKPGLPASPFLYPILDTQFSSDPVRDAQDLIRAGVSILQLRAKMETRRKIYELTTELSYLCAERNVCLIVNDCVDVVLVTDGTGVHLGQEDFPVDEARKLLPDRIIGLSTHNDRQFRLANQKPINYIAIGPVYESKTKRSINPYLGLSQIIPLLTQKSKPVVAIGGIQRAHIRELLSAGIDGIAMISELYRYGSIYDSTRRILDEMGGTLAPGIENEEV